MTSVLDILGLDSAVFSMGPYPLALLGIVATAVLYVITRISVKRSKRSPTSQRHTPAQIGTPEKTRDKEREPGGEYSCRLLNSEPA